MDDEKKLVEDYLAYYCLEECLDEAINNVVIEKPKNPYLAIAAFMETKLIPEILDITLKSHLVGRIWGVKATVLTNLSSFCGVATYSGRDMLSIKEYAGLEERARSALLGMDPTQIALIDSTILTIPDIDKAESLALSIACYRAAARHRGIQPYQVISGFMGLQDDEVTVPVPVVPILSRIIAPGNNRSTQDIYMYAIKAPSFELALQLCAQLTTDVARLPCVRTPLAMSACGCACVETMANATAPLKVMYCHSCVATN